MNNMTQSTKLSRLTATVLLGTLAMGFAAICPAGDGTSVLQEKVKYADLDVSRPAGAAALYFRISIAADDVCRDREHGDLSSKLNFNRCVHQAIANAVAEVDQPALYSVYNVKNPAPKPVMLAAGPSR